MDNKAIRPNFINPITTSEKVLEKKGASDEERTLFAMSKSGGWKVFKEIALRSLGELDELNRVAIANGAGYEELGRNTVVISSVKDIINHLINKVEDAKESCEDGESGE
jgi:hypothetical protein